MKLKHIFQYKINLTEIITSLYYLLFLLTPLLMFSRTSEIFEFNKMMFIYITTIVIGFLYILHLIIQKDHLLRHWIYIPIIAFLVSQFFSTIFSIDTHTSIYGYYGRWNGGLLSILSYLTLFTIFIQVMNVEKIKKLIKVTFISSAIVILWGIPGLFGHDISCLIFTNDFSNGCWTQDFNPAVRMFSTIGQPNWLGAYLVIHFFIGVYLFISAWTIKSKRLLYAAYLILNLVALYFTKSRSAWVALIFSAIIITTIYYYQKFKIHIQKRMILGVLTVTFLILAFSFNSLKKNLFTLPTETTQITDSSVIRKIVWKGAIDLADKYPLFGSGLETFAYSYNFTRPPEHNLTSEWDFVYNKAHNELLNYLATTGYIGFIAYLGLITSSYIVMGLLIREGIQKNEKDTIYLGILLVGSYTSIQITNFFGFSVSSIQLFFYLIPAIAIAYVVDKKKESITSINTILKSQLRTRVPVFVLTFILVGSLLSVARYYMADILYAKGRYAFESDQNLPAVNFFKQAMALKYEHVYEDRLSSAIANVAYEQALQKDFSGALASITESQQRNLHTLALSPKNILYWRTKGKNYYMYYQITQNKNDLYEAVNAMEKMIEIAPTDVQSRYTVALFYWIVSNEIKDKQISTEYHQKAKNELSTVLKMKPNYIEAQELLGSL